MMNLPPMVQKKMQQMIQQKYGTPENMLNDMKNFAGNNPALKNALDLFEKGDTKGLEQMQNNLFDQKKINPINMLQNFLSMK